jgi:hypothetical protein
LFQEGRALAKNGNYAEACDRFAKSYELDRGVGTELNLADCQDHLGHSFEAWRLFEDAAKQSSTNPTRAKFARDRAIALEAKLATIVVMLGDADVAGVAVTIGGKTVMPAAEIRQRLDPGSVDIVIVRPGAPPVRKSLQAAAGKTTVFDVPTASIPDVPSPSPQSGSLRVSELVQLRKSRVRLALGLWVGGALGLATSAGLGLKAKSDYDTAKAAFLACATDTCQAQPLASIHHAQHLADAGTVFAIVGAGLLAGGAVAYITAPHWVARPIASKDSIGMSVSGRF